MSILEIKTVRTSITRTVEIDRDLFLKLLAPQIGSIPDDAYIYMTVPGGGDWSNTQLDLLDTPLIVTWTETKQG